MPDAPVVLHQFLRSHFNEKARWALDWKRVPHTRRTYLPGPHLPALRRLSGQSATPVLAIGGEVVTGSAAIVDALERRFPERPLYPEDPALRERALGIQRRFDEEVGPAARTALFSVLLQEPGYLCGGFAARHPAFARALYRASFPLTRGPIARANRVSGAAAVARAFERARAGLDFVAREAGPGGQLAGERFSVADLAGAALLSLLANPEHPDMPLPAPRPARVDDFLARFADHPGTRWVHTQYARHRPASSEV
jgi:glutathione S-transferase